jgi:phenylacetate-coenzyme A ligase PaaK-like adenylate-forming protein
MSRDTIIAQTSYSQEDAEKCAILLPIIKAQLKTARQNNRHIDNFFSKQGIEIDSIAALEDVPFIPVQMFKYFDLRTCPEQEIVKILQSSGTTGGQPSRIPLDKATTMNQIKALKSTLSDYLGNSR